MPKGMNRMRAFSPFSKMMASNTLVSLGLCLAALPGEASAVVYGSVQETGSALSQPASNYSDATQLQITQSTTPYSGATLFSDSDTGVMRLNAKGLAYSGGLDQLGHNTSVFFTTRTTVSMVDNVTFQGYSAGETGSLYYSVDGSFQQSGYQIPGGAVGYGEYSAKVYDGVQNYMDTVGYAATASQSSTACWNTTECLVGESPSAIVGVISFPLTDAKYVFNMFIQMTVTGGYIANFSSTAKAYLSLPAGVTYTSSSGGFLTLASPINPVPEPETYSMLVAGLGFIAFFAHRRNTAGLKRL